MWAMRTWTCFAHVFKLQRGTAKEMHETRQHCTVNALLTDFEQHHKYDSNTFLSMLCASLSASRLTPVLQFNGLLVACGYAGIKFNISISNLQVFLCFSGRVWSIDEARRLKKCYIITTMWFCFVRHNKTVQKWLEFFSSTNKNVTIGTASHGHLISKSVSGHARCTL